MLRTAATLSLTCVVIIGVFYVLPVSRLTSSREVFRIGADVAAFAAVLSWQIRRISAARLPELRAVEALGAVIALFLVAFSATYLSMSHNNVATFSQQLDHTRALYFTITVFSTVGFGDITPRTDAARLVVSAQMLLDLAIIGAVVRLIFNAARTRVSAGPDARPESPPAA